MTQDEIRKLLGGYATDTLSADERRALFEAALDDQELFNALQDEDALRELLVDPVTRAQVRQALEAPARRPGFWSRRWVLGVAVPAVVAVILIVIMNRANAPRLIAPEVQIASRGPAPAEPLSPLQTPAVQSPVAVAPAAPRPAAKERAIKKETKQSAPLREFAPRILASKATLSAAPAIPDAIRQQFASGFANAPLYQGPLVKHSLLRSGPSGEAVQVDVTPAIAGYLALFQLDAAGNERRIYPVADPAARVLPGVAIRIPSSPIKIADAGTRLRLVLAPAAVPAAAPATGVVGGVIGGLAGGAVNGAPQRASMDASEASRAPLVVDIPLAP